MRILRLEWAGLQLTTPSCTLYIDAIAEPGPRMRAVLREPEVPLLEPTPPATPHAMALVTHVHDDHYDPGLLRRVLGPAGVVLCPPSMLERARDDGLVAHPMAAWSTFDAHEVRITALPAVDGVGDEQVSYAVQTSHRTVLHAGDTLWHGHWWAIARRVPRIDVAFLPVNGARLAIPGQVPSGIETVMTPEQAVGAARALRARALCPIHYDAFERAPYYVQTPDALPRLRRAAEAAEIALTVCAPGMWWSRPGDSDADEDALEVTAGSPGDGE